jgi:hypothetical protein
MYEGFSGVQALLCRAGYDALPKVGEYVGAGLDDPTNSNECSKLEKAPGLE